MAYFLALAAACVLVGLLIAAKATTATFGAFGFALLAFGVLFGFQQIKAHFDARDAAHH
jgi:hypothetical protein